MITKESIESYLENSEYYQKNYTPRRRANLAKKRWEEVQYWKNHILDTAEIEIYEKGNGYRGSIRGKYTNGETFHFEDKVGSGGGYCKSCQLLHNLLNTCCVGNWMLMSKLPKAIVGNKNNGYGLPFSGMVDIHPKDLDHYGKEYFGLDATVNYHGHGVTNITIKGIKHDGSMMGRKVTPKRKTAVKPLANTFAKNFRKML